MNDPAFPSWLHDIAVASLMVGGICALITIADEFRRPNPMWIMNFVWPICMLFGSALFLALYWLSRERSQKDIPMWLAVAKGASHCGAGCTLGDIIVEWTAVAVPGIATLFGWHSLFAERTFALWIPDYIVAFLIGIAFQYFTIAPMRHLGLGDGIAAAVKADVLSITSWQVGMYGAMAVAQFALLKPAFGHVADPSSVEFWFIMQVAMLAGFATAYPVNRLLIRQGLKERM